MNRRIYLALLLIYLLGSVEELHAATLSSETLTNMAPFKVHWPLIDPNVGTNPKAMALLQGRLEVVAQNLVTTNACLRISMTLVRPEIEVNRRFWNTALAFPQFEWMQEVRVWSVDEEWLWPNLPYLFKVHGKEREDRYGGWDPGKGIDNDFAAVLIRKYEGIGENELPTTRECPLVSADWYPVGNNQYSKQSIVHQAKSDEFVIHVFEPGKQQSRGHLKLWLIYADFMNAPVPKSWSKTPEFNGGTLAYFVVSWETRVGQPLKLDIVSLAPTLATGFNWQKWTARYRREDAVIAKPKLTDW